jgi:hypothetical protein
MLVEVKEKTEKKNQDYHDKIKSGTNNLKLVPNQLRQQTQKRFLQENYILG